ncbi:hypothetical protein EAH73_15730 [Hymenobacter nivis]|uniref:Apea-like HEPN domain-containing protein n=2 Tax=Hymenobacter nivis TaxID=1850093 RepID=A0A502GT20_9BACT|nr:hypothetical protein EAH73_15730 [Hymenobacter nivis]
MLSYQGSSDSYYVFFNSWNFRYDYESVITCEIIKTRIFEASALHAISTKLNINLDLTEKSDFLLKVQNYNSELLDEFSFGTGSDGFKLKNLKVKAVDNLEKEIHYEGSFLGNSADISPLDWGLFSTVKVLAIPLEISREPFYLSLLAEGYLNLLGGNYRLAFFIIFSAYEGFINFNGGDKQERLKDKINFTYKSKFVELNKVQTYSSVINGHDKFEELRNDVAHGREKEEFTKQMVEDLLMYVTVMMCSYDNDVRTFEDLAALLQPSS